MRHEAQLNAPASAKDPTLGTMRVHLESAAARGSALAIARLEGPEPPEDLLYLLEYAEELARGRRYSVNGPEPIGWTDIHAWAQLTGRHPEPDEVHAILLIDAVLLNPGEVTRGDS